MSKAQKKPKIDHKEKNAQKYIPNDFLNKENWNKK